jgi:hypothetical protein
VANTLSSWPFVSADLATIYNVIWGIETGEDRFLFTFNQCVLRVWEHCHQHPSSEVFWGSEVSLG